MAAVGPKLALLIATMGATTALIAAGADALRFALFVATVGTAACALACLAIFAVGVFGRDRDQQ